MLQRLVLVALVFLFDDLSEDFVLEFSVDGGSVGLDESSDI